MGSHPINLVIRFLLELTALVAGGMWGWQLSDSPLKFVLAIAIPLLIAGTWGTFAVPDDPSRSGKAPIPVPGIIRLLIESAVFAFAIFSLYDLGYMQFSRNLSIAVIVHYATSYDRILWLIRI